MMKYIKQFCVILTISFIGELLSFWIPLPVPASIYGILILFFGLLTKRIALEQVKDAGRFLIEIMPVMFVPAGVGLLEAWELIREEWLKYIALTLVTTVLVMAAAGRATQWCVRRRSAHEK